MKTNQNDMILNHLKLYGSITPIEALRDYGCMRLAARVSDLRREGYPIAATMETGINRNGAPVRYTRYTLEAVK